jgi:hypothetical protein
MKRHNDMDFCKARDELLDILSKTRDMVVSFPQRAERDESLENQQKFEVAIQNLNDRLYGFLNYYL